MVSKMYEIGSAGESYWFVAENEDNAIWLFYNYLLGIYGDPSFNAYTMSRNIEIICVDIGKELTKNYPAHGESVALKASEWVMVNGDGFLMTTAV